MTRWFEGARLGLVICVSLVVLAGCENPQAPVDSASVAEGMEQVLDARLHAGQLDWALKELLIEHGGGEGLDFFRLPFSAHLHRIPQDPSNPLTFKKIRLGKYLYHETCMGANNVRPEGFETYSCSSCHFMQAGFQANLPQGIGEGGSGFGVSGEGRTMLPEYDCSPDEPDVQPIRSPSSMNTAYQELMLWNGSFGGVGDNIGTEDGWEGPQESNYLGFQGLESQAHGGLLAHRMVDFDVSRLGDIPAYERMFRLAYPDDAEPINRLNAALAIAAYERSLLANRAPFQKWLRGARHAMTEQQKRGALVFFGKGNCVACHAGPALNGMEFHALGMLDLDSCPDPRFDLARFGGTIPEDVRKGRGGFTGRAADMYKFKTPQLYNLMDSPFYGHGASFSTVRDVVEYKNAAIPANPGVPLGQLAEQFVPLGLTEEEVEDLVVFLEEALHDDRLERYLPGELPSGNCFPVNDPQARIDLGCGTLARVSVQP